MKRENKTYEYKYIDHDMFTENSIVEMNQMGENGWDIIRILDPMKYLNSEGEFIRIYYKREKKKLL